MAAIRFDVHSTFEASPQAVWDELIDWEGHGAWVPMTRVDVAPGDPTAVGATFTAWTGLRPLALEDRMRVTVLDWDAGEGRGECEVEKLGPILRGRAAFTVAPDGDGAAVEWIEDVTVRRVPQFVAPVAARIGALGFRYAMRRLGRLLARR